jgi:DNA-binding NtrC family response regulator
MDKPQHRLADDETDIPRGRGEHILVVDDEDAMANLLELMLCELGYRCDAFTSTAEALQAFRAAPGNYAAVITDERMPGMWGTALVQVMHSVRADLPALLVSGQIDAGLLARAHGVGVPQVLKKPLVRRHVAVALARLLAQAPPD